MIRTPALFKAVTTLLILFSFNLALAAVPPTLNYQGHLTDSAGVPIDGPVNMVFSIYDIDTGGTALWSDTRSLTVEQGVFSIELGDGVNPFPLGLFENPLWMSLTVGTDAEMSPRRPISSVGFSFKASDADTLEGVSATTLDQSAHVIDNANPHNVTAAQTGAADAATLTTHTSDTTNPHSVTAAQAGAASSVDFGTHTSDNAAHHTRYDNVEAVAAMGAKSESNAYNHDKYTDTNAVIAMLAADGAGSTLDADLVDGLQASELIDAAQDEVRTPISSLPFFINQPGSYYLTSNLNANISGIVVSVDDVTIDLMGFTIDGSSGGNVGIELFSSNTTILNGTIKKFSSDGIRGAGIVNQITIRNLTISDNLGSGVLLNGSNHVVESCKVISNSQLGIVVGDNALVTNNLSQSNGSEGIYSFSASNITGNITIFNGGYGILGGTTSVIRNNITFFNNGGGIWSDYASVIENNSTANNSGDGISAGWDSTVINNTAFMNNGIYGIYGGMGSFISGNTSRRHDHGIYAEDGSRVDNNTVNENFTYGIRTGENTIVSNNTAVNNSGFAGIRTGEGSSIVGNMANYNSWGIYSDGSGRIKNNQVNKNNTGGIRVFKDTQVKDNTANGNFGINILAEDVGNTLEENMVANGDYGIQFTIGNGNFFANNRARSNTTSDYDNVGTNVDGGGNISF